MDVTGAGQTNVSRTTADDWGGAWAPDGRLYFTSERNENVELGVANADGTAVRTIASSRAEEAFPAWSPNGRNISFSSARYGDMEIYVSSASGARVRQLTRNAVQDTEPAWSPTGRNIAFIQEAKEGHDELWVVDADGDNARRILRADTLLHAEWSPNGRWIALRLDANIAVVPSSGGHPRLVAWAGSSSYPTWSPDGKWIAFTSFRNDTDGAEIYVVPFRGGPTTRVTRDAEGESEQGLDWSPDGKWIAFARSGDEARVASIYVIRPDGTSERRVPLPTAVSQPSWQPLP
jgi:TolB protein